MSFWFYSVTMFLVLQLTSYQKLVLCEPQMDDHFEGQRAYKPPPRPWPDPRTTQEPEPDPGPTWCIMEGYPCGRGIDGRCCGGLYCSHYHYCKEWHSGK